MNLVREHLEQRGLTVERRAWDDPDFDWNQTAFIIFRSTWDYFDRYPEFSAWLEKVKSLTMHDKSLRNHNMEPG